MKIISIRWRSIRGLTECSDFVFTIVNDGDAKAQHKALQKADTQGLFDIACFGADTYAEALAFVQHENSEKGVSAL